MDSRAANAHEHATVGEVTVSFSPDFRHGIVDDTYIFQDAHRGSKTISAIRNWTGSMAERTISFTVRADLVFWPLHHLAQDLCMSFSRCFVLSLHLGRGKE